MAAPDLALENLGKLLPAYHFESVLADGEAGTVCKARQRSLDRPVTIKLLHARFAAKPRYRAAFEREARGSANLNHPNLLAIYEFGEIHGHLFLVSEYVHGKPLANSARGRAVDPKQAATIALGIARGVAHLHRHDAIHRDLKPSNILLTPAAEPKIGDFGLAHGTTTHTHDDSGYLAPELLRDPNAFTTATDVFAVGAILHELLTGKPAADGLDPKHLLAIPDRRLREIVATATHRSPARRPSAADLARSLDSWLNGDKPKSAAARLAVATDPTDPTAAQRRPAQAAAPAAAAIVEEHHAREAAKLGVKIAIILILSVLVLLMAALLRSKNAKVKHIEQEHQRQHPPTQKSHPKNTPGPGHR